MRNSTNSGFRCIKFSTYTGIQTYALPIALPTSHYAIYRGICLGPPPALGHLVFFLMRRK